MRRSLRTIAAIVSLLVFVAMVALWVHSFEKAEIVRHSARWTQEGDLTFRRWELDSSRGELGFYWVQGLVAGLSSPRQGWEWFQEAPTPPRMRKERLFYFTLEVTGWKSSGDDALAADDRQMRTIFVVVPYAGLAIAFAVISLVFGWRAWVLSARSEIGRCTSCGYNLTGNTSGTCPECGTPVS